MVDQKTEKKQKERGKTFTGTVVGVKMAKTIVVEVEFIRHHPLYKKAMKHTMKFLAHWEGDKLIHGDTVRIKEIPPISKRKHFQVVECIEHKERV